MAGRTNWRVNSNRRPIAATVKLKVVIMRHRVSGRTLNRTSSHRKAMRRNMAIALFQHGAIRTTEAKAKELRPFVEKLITHARKGTLHARRLISAELGNRRGSRGVLMNDDGDPQDKGLLEVLFDDIAPRYADRPGGYTRIIRLAERRLGDAGKQVILQLVEETKATGDEAGGGSRRQRRAAKRHEALAATETDTEAAADESVADESVDESPAADQADDTGAAAEDQGDDDASDEKES